MSPILTWLRKLFRRPEKSISCSLCGYSTDELWRMHSHILTWHADHPDRMTIPRWRIREQ